MNETRPTDTLGSASANDTVSDAHPTVSDAHQAVPVSPTAPASPATPATEYRKPRIRAGAIAWGLIVTAIAWFVLATVTDADSREDFADWLGGATPAGIAIVAVLAVGVFILLLAGLALIRRAQRR